MTEEQMNRLESIIRTWLNNGAKCNSALKAYERSLYPTYDPGLRTKRQTSSDRSSSKKKKTSHHPHHSIRSNDSVMIQLCEEFLRNNPDLFDQ